MKTLLIAGVGALAMVAGNAFAEGCIYGSPASMASVDAAQESSSVANDDSRLIALLRKQEEGESDASVVQN